MEKKRVTENKMYEVKMNQYERENNELKKRKTDKKNKSKLENSRSIDINEDNGETKEQKTNLLISRVYKSKTKNEKYNESPMIDKQSPKKTNKNTVIPGSNMLMSRLN